MASDVAPRMPGTDDWRDPNRITAGVFGAHIHPAFAKNLKKVLVRERATQPPPPPTNPVNQEDPNSGNAELPETPSAADKRRQSQILDRWAAKQAREMVTTIERQSHEAELSALSTTTQPVSARAATFLRESSPAFSDSSAGSNGALSVSASASVSGSIDLPQNVRASSLIQMWRELEAEAGLSPSHRTVSSGSVTANAASSSDSEASGEWESDMTTAAASEPLLVESSSKESEKGRVGSIVRMLSMGIRTRRIARSCMDESETREPTSARARLSGEQMDVFGVLGGRGLMRLRCRREMEDLVERMEKERRREIAELAEKQPVSRFAHRGRIQAMLKLRFLRRDLAVQDQPRPASRTWDLERPQSGTSILFIRERFDHRCRAPIMESASIEDVQFPMDSQDSTHSSYNRSPDQFKVDDNPYQEVDQFNINDNQYEEVDQLNIPNNQYQEVDQFTVESNQYQEIVSTGDPESSPLDSVSPQSRSDQDSQEASQSIEASWDDRSLWVSNLDWQREVVTEELEPYNQDLSVSTNHSWIGDSTSTSWRGWTVNRQAMYHDFLENFSDNVEIRELLERKRVSTSLASDFCDKMNRLVMSFLHRQGQYVDENYGEEYEEQPNWRQNCEYHSADQEASGSSLVPLSYHSAHYPTSWQHSSYAHHSSQNLQESESMHDLKNDMEQMRQEISGLRKLVENCIEWQEKLEHSIKEEVSSAVRRQIAAIEKDSPCPKDSRHVCDGGQADSMLHRCGHTGTCFKCAHESQWGSGRCPVCRSPIADDVRAYPNT